MFWMRASGDDVLCRVRREEWCGTQITGVLFNARPLAKTSLRPPLIAAAASWALAQQN